MSESDELSITRKSRSLRPSTPVTMSVTQVLMLALAIGGFTFTLGAVYPRIAAIEGTISDIQKAQEKTARTLVKLSTIVERIDSRQSRRSSELSSGEVQDE